MSLLEKLRRREPPVKTAPPVPGEKPPQLAVASEWPLAEFSGWTLENVAGALDSLGSGDLGPAARLALALEKDLAYQHGARVRTQALGTVPVRLEWRSEVPSFLREELESHWPQLLSPPGEPNALLAATKARCALGVAPCAVSWHLSPSRRSWLPSLHFREPGRLRFDREAQLYRFFGKEGEEWVVPDGRRWLLFSEKTALQPHLAGLVRALAAPVWFKQACIRFWGQYNHAHGSPSRKVKVPGQQRESEDLGKLVKQVRALQNGSLVICPQYQDRASYDIELVEATAASWETFPAFLSYTDRWVTLAWLWAWDHTQGGDLGSRARAEVHERVSHSATASDCSAAAEALDVLLRQWAAYNRLDPASAPRVVFSPILPEQEEARCRVRRLAAEAVEAELRAARLLLDAGVPVDLRALAERAGFPLSKGSGEPPGAEDP